MRRGVAGSPSAFYVGEKVEKGNVGQLVAPQLYLLVSAVFEQKKLQFL